MAVFNPQLLGAMAPAPAVPDIQTPTMPTAPIEQAPMPEPIQAAPVAPQPQIIMKPVLVPMPYEVKPKAKGLQISPEAIRKAQGIYPAEQNKKQTMIENAKAPPTPTGAWGAPV